MSASRLASSAYQDDRPNYIGREVDTSSFAPRGMAVRVANPRSTWMAELSDKFDELVSLPRGWDGYAGRPVSFTCAQFAANLIERLYLLGVPKPLLVPGGDGTVQIEWHLNQFDIEIDVLGPYEVNAVRRNLITGETEEQEFQTDYTLLSDWIASLKGATVIPMRAQA